jgi:hypothetical protein
MSKHTPGPWWPVDDDHPVTADGYVKAIVAEKPSIIVAYSSEDNARLIAAAPELLEALRQLMFRTGHKWEEGGNAVEVANRKHVRELARAAIAKAEGKDS